MKRIYSCRSFLCIVSSKKLQQMNCSLDETLEYYSCSIEAPEDQQIFYVRGLGFQSGCGDDGSFGIISCPPQNRCEGVPFYSQLWLPTSVCNASLSTLLYCTLYCARDTLIRCYELLKPLCNQFLKIVIPRIC